MFEPPYAADNLAEEKEMCTHEFLAALPVQSSAVFITAAVSVSVSALSSWLMKMQLIILVQ